MVNLQFSRAVCFECQPVIPAAISVRSMITTRNRLNPIHQRQRRQHRASGDTHLSERTQAGTHRRRMVIERTDRERHALRHTKKLVRGCPGAATRGPRSEQPREFRDIEA